MRGASTAERAGGTALRTLRADSSDSEWLGASEGGDALGVFVAERRSADLRAGRTRLVDGWWLAETEVAVAVLAVHGRAGR